MATPSARFRLALSTGFVIASVGMATVSIGRSGHAQDFLAGISNLFGIDPQVASGRVASGSDPAAGVYARGPSRSSERARRHRGALASGEARRRLVSVSHDTDEPLRLGRASICVRLCDGFAFPVGDFHGQGDIEAHETTCRSECPGARTALYVLPTGSSTIGEAVEARTGQTYSQRSPSFHYTTFIDESCSCHPREGNRIASLLHDYTLRRGDAVMTASGVKVFHGGEHFPFRQADFVRLAQSRDVQKAARATFRDIERASVTVSHPTLAQGGRPMPAAGLEALEHQAANYSPRR